MNGDTRDPWAVLLSYLGELKSDEVVRIVSRTGLSVDWTLSEKENYSHGTRVRVYLPRIGAAFDSLRQEEKPPVFRKALTELVRVHPRSEELQLELETQTTSADGRSSIKVAVPISVDPKKVFVVHGRDKWLKDGLFVFLQALGLEPIDWAEAIRFTRKGSPFIGEVLDAAFNQAQAIVVLLSPDDEVRLSPELLGPTDLETEKEFRLQPRPNVLFEAGMGFGRNPDRTILVEVGELKAFSDVAGRHVVRLSNDEVRRKDLADRLTTAGCSVKVDGDDWKTAGDFVVERPSARGRGPLNRAKCGENQRLSGSISCTRGILVFKLNSKPMDTPCAGALIASWHAVLILKVGHW